MDTGPDVIERENSERGADRFPDYEDDYDDRTGDAVLSIRETESRILATVREIRQRLSPDYIERYAWSAAREKLFERMDKMLNEDIVEFSEKIGHAATETVKRHPGSVALMGLGLGLFALESLTKKSAAEKDVSTAEVQVGSSYPEFERPEPEFVQQASEPEAQPVSRIREKAGRLRESALQKTAAARDRVSKAVDERPLILGCVGLTAGVIIGIVTSGYLRENEFLGETRETIKQKTRELLHDTRAKAEHVLDQAKRAAREEAERQHIITH